FTVRFFSALDQAPVHIDFIDMQGVIRSKSQTTTKLGMNTVVVKIGSVSSGQYVVRTTIDQQVSTIKVQRLSE
ncbi:hypothetical protein LC612_38595, partial [Nostoc sp. CHAB 5834]|nr:hypothetical protein [Nostoc sp. CHAB 5834]